MQYSLNLQKLSNLNFAALSCYSKLRVQSKEQIFVSADMVNGYEKT